MKWCIALALLGGCLFAPSNDIYGFNYDWTKKGDGGAPGPMHGAKLTNDRGGARGTVVMYSGRNRNAPDGIPSGLLWMWKDEAWKPICTNPDGNGKMPAPVYLPGFTWIEDTKMLMIAGGARVASGQQQLYGDVSDEVWACDETDTWKMVGKLQHARAGASLVYVRDLKEIRLIGGRDASQHFKNVEVAPSSITAPTPAGSFAVDPAQDMDFVSASSGQAATFDTNDGRVKVLESELTPDDSITPHDTIWEYTGTWDKICDDCSGVGRSDASIVHVEGSLETYVLGGYIGNHNNTSGTWILDQKRLVKVDSDPVERNAIGVASTFFDNNGEPDTLIMYGGTTPNSLCASYECSDTYEYRAVGL